jgi:hypothetical protein
MWLPENFEIPLLTTHFAQSRVIGFKKNQATDKGLQAGLIQTRYLMIFNLKIRVSNLDM